jgi:hypothetical protein
LTPQKVVLTLGTPRSPFLWNSPPSYRSPRRREKKKI